MEVKLWRRIAGAAVGAVLGVVITMLPRLGPSNAIARSYTLVRLNVAFTVML